MIWDCIPFAIFWTLWTKRNGVIFENEALDWEELLEQIKLTIIFWARIKWGSNTYTTEDFLFGLDSIISSLQCSVCVCVLCPLGVCMCEL